MSNESNKPAPMTTLQARLASRGIKIANLSVTLPRVTFGEDAGQVGMFTGFYAGTLPAADIVEKQPRLCHVFVDADTGAVCVITGKSAYDRKLVKMDAKGEPTHPYEPILPRGYLCVFEYTGTKQTRSKNDFKDIMFSKCEIVDFGGDKVMQDAHTLAIQGIENYQ